MQHSINSIRTFIGAKDYSISRQFYKDLGFEELVLSPKMCYFKADNFGFYLQDYYIKDWIDNSMVFIEVDSVDRYWEELNQLNLHKKYKNVRLAAIVDNDWGKECFLHDPSGILWHFGEFK